MTGYLLLAAFLAGLTIGGAGINSWKDGQIAKHQQAQAEADAKIRAQAAAATQEAENKIVDMTAAFEAGEANAKTITKTVYVKGQSYVASQPVFSNPLCVVPPDGMLVLNRQRASLRAAADPADFAPSVPAPGSDQGRPAGNALPPSDSGQRPVGGMPPPASSPGGGGQVSGPSVRPVPKPKPAG
jgi:hypothetical protein